MSMPWVIEELKDADLNDKRLNNRLQEVLSQLSGQPTASIPAACGGYAETTAAYRLFNNEKVGFDKILAPHAEATRRRIRDQSVVILAQDTTEIDVTRPEQQVTGTGPLGQGAKRGVFLHPLMAFTPDGTPLGTVHATSWARDDEPLPLKSQRKAQRQRTPIEQKESWRWIEALQHAREESQRAPETHFVCVADSEADIYELFVEAESDSGRVDWIVRACQDRALVEEDRNDALPEELEASSTRHLRETALGQDVLFTQTIQVRGRKPKVSCSTRTREQPRRSRMATVEVRAAQVSLRAPYRPDRKLPELTLHVVLVREVDPPEDDAAVEWMLLTNLPISTTDDVRRIIQYYCVRWMIEVFFRTLKSGCRIEERRFEHVDRLMSCVAVYLIVSWRTLYVCRLGREFPDISCEAVFEPAEWKSAWQIVKREPPPTEPPTLSKMVRIVARLGGYINRPRSDDPGPQTVWLGLQRLHDIALCWQIFGPEAKKTEAAIV